MKILWMAANITGYEWLKEAIKLKECEITNIITLNDRATTVMYDSIDRKRWYKFNIPVYEIEKTNDEVNLIKKLKPECIVVGGWRQFIGPEILSVVPKGVIGFHPTLLPKGRGPSPIINSIMAGIKESGLTMFYYNEQLDVGDIIAQEPFVIGEDDYAWDIYKKEINAGKALIKEFLPQIAKDIAPRIPQTESRAQYFLKGDVKIFNVLNLEDSTSELYRKIRALSKHGKNEGGKLSYLGAHILLNDKKIKIWRAKPIDLVGYKNKNIGDIIQIQDGTVLKTKDGYLLLQLLGFGDKEFEKKDFKKINSLEELLK